LTASVSGVVDRLPLVLTRLSLFSLGVIVLAGCTIRTTRLEQTPIATPDLPRVQFLYPENNSIVIEGTDLRLDILAEDESVGVAQIEVFVDGASLVAAPPPDALVQQVYRIETNWLAQGIGLHTISAIASRPDGTQSDEVTIVVDVQLRPTDEP